MPRVTIVAHLTNPDNVQYQKNFDEGAKAAALKMKLLDFQARNVSEFEAAFVAMVKARVDAVMIAQDNLFTSNHDRIAALATKHRLPSVGAPELAEAGGTLGYGSNKLDLFRRSAVYVDEILRSAKPAELPVVQPTKFELALNMKTVKALGIKIPNSILARADKVIE